MRTLALAALIAAGLAGQAAAQAPATPEIIPAPGGEVIIPTPSHRKAYDAYSFAVIPEIGARVVGDRASYQYLVESIRRFPDQATFARMITEAGFSQTGWTNFTAGVAALHTARAI